MTERGLSRDAEHAAERRAQLTIAAGATRIGDDGNAALARWVAALPAGAIELGASVRGDLRAFTARATADVPVLFTQLDDLLDGAGDPDGERERLQRLGNALAPPRLGTWLSAVADDEGDDTLLDAGWTFHGSFVLASVLPHLPATEPVAAVMAWARRHAVATCEGVARSLGDDNPFTEIVVAIPTPDAVQDLLTSAGATLPHGLVTQAGDATRVRTARVAFTERGVARVALRFPAPTRGALLPLVDQVGGAGREQDRALATIDAALANDGPRAIELVATAEGPALEIVYTLEALGVDDDD